MVDRMACSSVVRPLDSRVKGKVYAWEGKTTAKPDGFKAICIAMGT